MANQKTTELTADTAPTDADLVMTVDDVAGTPTNKKVTLANLAAGAPFTSRYQPLDSDLTAIAALTTTAFGRALLALADAAAGRTALGLGTAATSASGDFQPVDSDLTAIAALTTTAYGRSVLETANAAALRSLAGAVIGTDVQAYDAELAAIAGLTSAADRLPYFTGLGTASLATFTAAGRALVDDADAAAQRTTLGLDTVAATLPLDVSSSGGVSTLRAYEVPSLKAAANLTPSAAVGNTTTETAFTATGWTTVGSPQQVNVGDMIEWEIWGTRLNNTGADQQTDFRLRIGGLAGTAVPSVHRIPATASVCPAASVARAWRIEGRGIVRTGLTMDCHSRLVVAAASVAAGIVDTFTNYKQVTLSAVTFSSNQEWLPTVKHNAADANLTAVMLGCWIRHTPVRP